jgi:hypothetical protein
MMQAADATSLGHLGHVAGAEVITASMARSVIAWQ